MTQFPFSICDRVQFGKKAAMDRFQILSLIGGGIRGAFITSYLKELEIKLGRPIAESFDLIAGTSTGGIIAAGLALGMSAEEMHKFYVDHGSQIFSPRPPYHAKGWMRLVFPLANWVFQRRTGRGLDSAFRARFCPHALQAAFDEGFADGTLKSVKFTRLIIPTVNLTRGQPHIFRSRHPLEAKRVDEHPRTHFGLCRDLVSLVGIAAPSNLVICGSYLPRGGVVGSTPRSIWVGTNRGYCSR